MSPTPEQWKIICRELDELAYYDDSSADLPEEPVFLTVLSGGII